MSEQVCISLAERYSDTVGFGDFHVGALLGVDMGFLWVYLRV